MRADVRAIVASKHCAYGSWRSSQNHKTGLGRARGCSVERGATYPRTGITACKLQDAPFVDMRGDGHFANPELMKLIIDDGNADFIFGLTGNAILSRKAEGLMRNARGHLDLHRLLAAQGLKNRGQTTLSM